MSRKKSGTENMQHLSTLLDRYQNRFTPPQASIVSASLVVIKKETGIDLSPRQITYTVATRTLSIQAPSLLRSEIKMHHIAILKALKDTLGVRHAPTSII